jgi:hypothetical protein
VFCWVHYQFQSAKQLLIAPITSQAPAAGDRRGKRHVDSAGCSAAVRDAPDDDRIINADESCWQVYPAALKTWAPTGSQNVQLAVNGNEKNSFTVMAAISTARTTLPLCMRAADKTSVVDVGYHDTAHSE